MEVAFVCMLSFACIVPFYTPTTILEENSNQYASYEYVNMDNAANNKYEYIDSSEMDNLSKLNDIRQLSDNWDGYGALKFKPELIELLENIITNLDIQPELYPTGRDSIQIEYEKDTGEYLEFEIFSKDLINVVEIKSNGREAEYTMSYDILKMNQMVNDFYGTDN